MIGWRRIDPRSGGLLPQETTVAAVQRDHVMLVGQGDEDLAVRRNRRGNLGADSHLPQLDRIIRHSGGYRTGAQRVAAEGGPVLFVELERLGIRSRREGGTLDKDRSYVLGRRRIRASRCQRVHAVQFFVDVTLARVRRSVLQPVGRHHPDVTRTANPVVNRVLFLLQVDVLRPPAAGQNVPLGGLVAVTTMVMMGVKYGSQVDLPHQLAGLQIIAVGRTRRQGALRTLAAAFKDQLVQLITPGPYQTVDHEDIFPRVPQMLDETFRLFPKLAAVGGGKGGQFAGTGVKDHPVTDDHRAVPQVALGTDASGGQVGFGRREGDAPSPVARRPIQTDDVRPVDQRNGLAVGGDVQRRV